MKVTETTIPAGIETLEELSSNFPDFSETIAKSGVSLTPDYLEILQINVGYMCNISCDHCHVSAGPTRKEIMTKETMELCLNAIDSSGIKTVDLTGGAPEMNPEFLWFIEQLSKRNLEILVRSNLTILTVNKRYRKYPEFFKKHGVIVIASLPCYTEDNTDRQRGDGVFGKSIKALKQLNEIGYGKPNTGLLLHLVYNPGGASLPPDQAKLKIDYQRELKTEFGVCFNDLYTITNLPIGRFQEFLQVTGRSVDYMNLLVDSFNPAAVKGVMCRNTLSVGWDGRLFDCDFNQILNLKLEDGAPLHIGDFDLKTLQRRSIITNLHCYGCTAGAGSSCQGALI